VRGDPVTKAEIESKALQTLERFASLDFQTLRDLVICRSGDFSFEREIELKGVLQALTDRGVIGAADRQFGPFWLPARSATAGGGISGAVISAVASARATLRRPRSR